LEKRLAAGTQNAVIADLVEAPREYMLEESADEL